MDVRNNRDLDNFVFYGHMSSVDILGIWVESSQHGCGEFGAARDTRLQVCFAKLRQCCGSEMLIQEPGSDFFHPWSRVDKVPDPDQRIVSICNPKNWYLVLNNYIWDLHPVSWIWIFSHPASGSRIKWWSKTRWIPDPDSQHWLEVKSLYHIPDFKMNFILKGIF